MKCKVVPRLRIGSACLMICGAYSFAIEGWSGCDDPKSEPARKSTCLPRVSRARATANRGFGGCSHLASSPFISSKSKQLAPHGKEDLARWNDLKSRVGTIFRLTYATKKLWRLETSSVEPSTRLAGFSGPAQQKIHGLRVASI